MSYIGTHGGNPNTAQALTAARYRAARPKIPQIGLHTSESPAGQRLIALWQFINRRRDHGSYNAGSDVYGTANQYAPWSWYTWHAPAINPFAAGISANCQADQWDRISAAWRNNLINGLALVAHRYSRWCVSQGLGPVPARRLTAAQARAGHHGFVYHGSLQNDRTDPTGPRNVFPWTQFLNEFRRLERGGNLPPAVTTPPKEKPLSLTQANIDAIAQRVMTTPIRSGLSGNNVMVQTSLRQTQEALTNGRVFRNTIPSGISENNVMVQTLLRQTQQRADRASRQTTEILAVVESGFAAMAEHLDSLKPGLAEAVKGAVSEAAEKVRRDQVEITAREVAEELEITARAAQEDEAQDEEEES